MKAQSIIAVAALLALIASTGCDRSSSSNKPGGGSTTVRKKPVMPTPTAFGTIKGNVKLIGWNKPPAKIPDDCCKLGPNDLVDETVVQDTTGNLQHVILYIKDCPPTGKNRTEPALLDQVHCRYTPHVLAIQVDQPLDVRSSDNTIHNVHMLTQENPAVNFGMPKPETRRMSFSQPELFAVKCDIHPWMKAWIQVFDHPCFAVSAADGNFEIKDAPAGQWTLVAWHEKFGEIETPLNIPANGTVDTTIRFEAPRE